MVGIYIILMMGFLISPMIHNDKTCHEFTKQSYVGYMNGNCKLLNREKYTIRKSHMKSRRYEINKEQKDASIFHNEVESSWARYVRLRSQLSKRKWLINRYLLVKMPIFPRGNGKFIKTGDLLAYYKVPHFRPQFRRMVRCSFRSKKDHYLNWRNNLYLLKVHFLWPFYKHNGDVKYSWERKYMNRGRATMSIFGILSLSFLTYFTGFEAPAYLSLIGMLGVTYYWSYSEGDDNNDGLTQGAPKKTLYEMTWNNNYIGAGDTVYMIKGEVFQNDTGIGNDRFVPSATFLGEDGNELIVDGGTVGSGANAIIDGDAGQGMTQPVTCVNGVGWDYLYTMNFTVTGGSSNSYSPRNGGVSQLVGVTTDNIFVHDGGSSGIYGGNFDDWLITDCRTEDVAGQAVGINPGTMVAGESVNWTIRDCDAIQVDITDGDDGVQCHEGQVKQARGPGLYLRILSEGWTEQSYDYTTGGYDGNNTSLVLIGCDGSDSRGGIVWGHEHNYDDDGNGNVTHFCYSHIWDCDQDTDYFTIMVNSTRNIKIYQNLIEFSNGSRYGILLDRQQTDNYGPEGIIIQNNTFIYQGSCTALIYIGDRVQLGDTTGEGDNLGGIDDTTIQNNIFYSFGTGNVRVLWVDDTLDGVPTESSISNLGIIDYNKYYMANGTWTAQDEDQNTVSWSTWTTTYGYDTHGYNGTDPKLVDVTGSTDGFPDDAKLQSDSPAIGNAVPISSGLYYKNIPSADVEIQDIGDHEMTGITEDYYGVSR